MDAEVVAQRDEPVRRKGKDRRRIVIAATIVFGGLLLYAAFLAVVSERAFTQEDPEAAIAYRFVPDDDQRLGRPHLVEALVWSREGASRLSVTLWSAPTTEGPFTSVPMMRVGDGPRFVGELPSRAEGERSFYYLVAEDPWGATVNIPAHAPQTPLPHVRWEDHVSLPVLALHITLMIGAVFLLLHAVHFAVMVLATGARGTSQGGLVRRAHAVVRWGWTAFFVGGVPLGIYVSGTALSWPNAWGAWPLGTDITDTKTEILVVYWAAVILLRRDLWRLWRGRWARGHVGDRAFAWWILGGAVLTVVAYAIPHSFFFQ